MDELRLNAARIAALYTLARPAYATVLALTGILCVAFWEAYPAALLLGWLGAVIAVTLARVALHWQYMRAHPSPAAHDRWENWFAIGAFASATTWAFAALVLFPRGD